MGGRSIRIFLVDGSASGLWTAELGLSTIKALVVPRASLAAAAKRSELSRTGVYVLVGPDADRPGTRKVYIGEGDTIITRLTAHNKDADKDYWTEAVVLVSKDETLTKGHVRFLEARLIKLATEAKRSTLTNGTAPTDLGRLPEADEVEMSEFIEQARLLLGAVGYDLFEPASTYRESRSEDKKSQLPVFTLSGDGFNADCIVDSDAGQFVVKKGSRARRAAAESLVSTYRNLRDQLVSSDVLQLVSSDVLVSGGESFVFAQDYAFGAPSAAAAVVSGQTINGRKAWKKKGTGETFADWEDASLPTEGMDHAGASSQSQAN